MTTTWAKPIRTGPVRVHWKHNQTRHRGEVYGEQFDDDRIVWWRECADCGQLVRYPSWNAAISAAIRHHRGIA